MSQKLNAQKVSFSDLSNPATLNQAAAKVKAGTAVYVTFSYEEWNDGQANAAAAKLCREYGFIMQPNTSNFVVG